MKALEECVIKDDTWIKFKGVSEECVDKAEESLGVHFSEEYRKALIKFGVINIYGHEIVGLGSSKRLDVVYNTLSEREINDDFPPDQYVVEQAAIDGIVITQDKKGFIYQFQPGRPVKKIAGSLAEYLYK